VPKIYITEGDANKALKVVLVVGAIIALVLIGRAVTPKNRDGNLVFLSPRVAQIASYQRQAEKWAGELNSIEADTRALLNGDTTDLFAQDSAFRDINRRTTNLVSAIDATSTPDSLTGLRDLLMEAAAAHQEASAVLGMWISEPSADNKAAARDALSGAASLLDRVYNNPWVSLGQTEDGGSGGQ
jgi:hypothetical protein